MFENIRKFLEGKKTYLVSIGLIIAALVKYSVDGNLAELITAIFSALGLSTLRSGIAKNG